MENQPTKKKRIKKRFTSREQIIARIDKFTAKAKRKRTEQSQAYSEAGQLRRLAAEISIITKKEVLGDKLGRQADRLENDVFPKPKQKLAEFDTDVIPGITNDRSIEAI